VKDGFVGKEGENVSKPTSSKETYYTGGFIY